MTNGIQKQTHDIKLKKILTSEKMFRVMPYISRTRTVFQRYRPYKFSMAWISRSPRSLQYKLASESEREPCPPPPPIQPPPKDDRLLWSTLAVLVIAGGFGVYAKRSPEVRDWVTIHAPWFDDLIAIVYQENMTYMDFAVKCVGDLKCLVVDYMNNMNGPKDCSLPGDGESIGKAIGMDDSDDPPDDDFDEVDGEVEGPVEDQNEEEKPCEILPPPILTKDVCEIEACLKDLGDSAVHNYMTARDACIYYNKLVQDSMKKFSYCSMKKIRAEMEDRLDLVRKHTEEADFAHSQLNELSRYFECGVSAPPGKMDNTRAMLCDYQTSIRIVRDEFTWENAKALALDMQWQKVEETIDKYAEDNTTYYPGLDYSSAKLQLGAQDPDFLLHHSKRYVEYMEDELLDAKDMMTERVNRAVDIISTTDKERSNTQWAIQAGFKKALGEMEKDFANRYAEQKQDNDALLKESLKKQLQRHEENLASRLQQVEIEANAKLEKMIKDKVAEEKRLMTLQLRDMNNKLAIVESRLNERLKAEREQRRSQDLWTASASLLAATKRGDPAVRVEKELREIERASGDGDKLVLSVLHAIPNQVWDKGVVPESVLRENYHSMEKVALKVALVEDDGAPLPLYALSWVQSALLFMRMSTIPQSELDNPPKEPCKEAFKDLDTFDLLQRARYWVERGNIAAALRYVSYLQGASRVAAATWHDAARCHVEIRQAAEALIAHAAAMGLQYI